VRRAVLRTVEAVSIPTVALAVVAAFVPGRLSPATHVWLLAVLGFTLLALFGALLVLLAFAVVLGLHVSLRLTNSRLAIVNTLATVFFLSVGTLICIYLIVINPTSFTNQWLSFISFLVLGIGGLMWVLNWDRPAPALTLGSVFCPLAMFYCVTNILIAVPGTPESSDPLVPFLVLGAAFGFTIYAMLLPLVTEFDVALGRTTAAYEE